MTNPGHIDPGYVGPMHFTVINMGSQAYVLEQGAVIVTVLLLRLDSPARRDWLERQGGQAGDIPVETYIGRLSADFIDFENRAKKIATDAISKAEWRAGAVAGIVTISVTILVALGGLVAAFLADVPFVARTAVGRLDKEVQELRVSLKGWEVRGEVTQLAKDLERVKAANCEVIQGLAYCPPKASPPKATQSGPEGKQK